MLRAPHASRQRAGRSLRLLALVSVLMTAWLVAAATAAADIEDERALAERYAPVVRLVEQEEECGHGEPYEPLDLEALFDEPTVALRGPWASSGVIEIGPSAEDLRGGLYEYRLDFPGNALEPGCDYEKWARRVTGDRAPAVYAHVAADPGYPGQIALQYWLFYAFNDWNNLHEGDWEMIQINFPAADAAAALETSPTRIGYSQHEGAEGADWGEEPLEIVDGTHPVVYPGAGSHANYYDSALFLGASASTGVGCDDTSGPSVELRPVVHTIPSGPAEAVQAFPWIEFEGRWGEFQPAFYNGPTGPNLKRQWTEPIAWSEGWRGRSYAVPGGGLLGTGATDFFCSAVASGSVALTHGIRQPLYLLLGLTLIVVLAVIVIRRTSWRPGTPFHVARRRSSGQILHAALRTYVRRPGLFAGIGLVALPVAVAVTLLQSLVVGVASAIDGDEGEQAGILAFVVVAIGTTLSLLTLALVQAATAAALTDLDAGRPTSLLAAYRRSLPVVARLIGPLALAVVIVTLLATTLIGLPIAVYLAIRWALVAIVGQIEGQTGLPSLGRSARVVSRGWLKVAVLIVTGAVLALLAGPIVGGLLIVLTDFPLALLNVVSGLVYAIALPFVALASTFVYLDLRARELSEPEPPSVVPAEFELEPATADTAEAGGEVGVA